jgi:hypothetical protein
MLGKAQEYVQGGLKFPWDANSFLKTIDGLDFSQMITKGFLQYCANYISLTALTFLDIVETGHVQVVKRRSDEKIAEYIASQAAHGAKGPYLIKQAGLRQKDWRLIRSQRWKNLPTDLILEQWGKLKELLAIRDYRSGQLLSVTVKRKDITQAIAATEEILRTPVRLGEVRDLAMVVAHSQGSGTESPA